MTISMKQHSIQRFLDEFSSNLKQDITNAHNAGLTVEEIRTALEEGLRQAEAEAALLCPLMEAVGETCFWDAMYEIGLYESYRKFFEYHQAQDRREKMHIVARERRKAKPEK